MSVRSGHLMSEKLVTLKYNKSLFFEVDYFYHLILPTSPREAIWKQSLISVYYVNLFYHQQKTSHLFYLFLQARNAYQYSSMADRIRVQPS